MAAFSAATRAWFEGSFAAPTPAQAGAWQAIGAGAHTLVVAPTGSGKTLSAFLWAIDRLASEPVPAQPLQRCRVLYISPLKALGVDVERNLRSPLVGIAHAAARLGLPVPQVSVGVRSGDTSATDRRAFAKAPTDILITTPESLFLLLTSKARQALVGVETIIIDEIHSVAGSKRGAHLALSLERLDALLPRPAQRIGLSATVRPLTEVARYLAGGRPVTTVAPPSTKQFALEVIVPVADLTQIGELTEDLTGPAAGQAQRSSIWPHLEQRLVELISQHQSTLIFVNSRQVAERLTARLNEAWTLQQGGELPEVGSRMPAEFMAQSRSSSGAQPVLARAHHGSVSKEQRAQIEDDLKACRLPAVVATSSLELGIDMGAIDLVVQVAAPPSVASGLQRVGRAGHQVGAVSSGVLLPKVRSDLLQSTVVVEQMLAGQIESLKIPANPLDVLAQQVVAMCAMDDWAVVDLADLCSRTASFASLPGSILAAVLDLLSGRYPSTEFAQLRPRITWDRELGTLTGRRGAQRLAVTSGGTIPDRGLFGVFLAGGEGPGRRVGELDEVMVYESRVGDVFTLGSSSWRIEQITHHQVLVSPAPGQPGKLPFWHGDSLGRPLELGRAMGAFVREVGALDPKAARARVTAAGLDSWAADNLLAYLDEQRTATGHIPDDRTIILERFRDELGDWRIVLHSPFGAQVHAPWAMAVASRLQDRFGVQVQTMHGDDGLVFRLPDLDWSDGAPTDVAEGLLLDPAEVEGLVTTQVGGSALFAARFRECAGRALLLPKQQPGQRQPLWQQRQRSAQLLEVASKYPQFPLVLETVRECLQDVFDVPGLVQLMTEIEQRKVRVLEVETSGPSPFARSLLFGYVAQFLYEGDSPLAERRAAALALDPSLLAELLGQAEGASLRELLDPAELARTEAELQWLTPDRAARDPDALTDLLRILGPLTLAELTARSEPSAASEVARWLGQLSAARRVFEVQIAGHAHWALVEDASALRDALGAALPLGLPGVFLEPVADPLTQLVSRYAQTHGPFTTAELAARFGLGSAIVSGCLRALMHSGRLTEGEFRPSGQGVELCDAQILRRVRRRSLAALRQQVEPISPKVFAEFLPQWQGVGQTQNTGSDAVLEVVAQLAGAQVPASALESLVLPARVPGYQPAMLDTLTTSGAVVWCGAGVLPSQDAWVSLHLRAGASLTLPEPGEWELSLLQQQLLGVMAGGGGYFVAELVGALAGGEHPVSSRGVLEALTELAWSGRVSCDTLAPVRVRLGAVQRSGSARRMAAPRVARRPRFGGGFGRVEQLGAADVGGRWFCLPGLDPRPTARAAALAQGLVDRFGVVTRGSVAAQGLVGGFAGVYRVLAASEEAGQVRRGYFIEGLGAAQFASSTAVDELRQLGDAPARSAGPVLLAACDPAQVYGAGLPWPLGSSGGGSHRPGRKAGAVVVLQAGELVLYLERGGKSLLTFSEDPQVVGSAVGAVARAVVRGQLGPLTVERVDGLQLLGLEHPIAGALTEHGFHPTTRGLRLRP